ncbi:MAG: hypothetical protein ACYDG3_11450, partial [Bacillati bacterium]
MEYRVKKEGGTRYYVVTDPRLPFVAHMLPEFGVRQYDEHSNEAYFAVKGPKDLKPLAEQLEQISWWPIENGHFAHLELASMGGVAVSKYDTGKRLTTRYVALSEETWNKAQSAVERRNVCTSEQAAQLNKALRDGVLRHGEIAACLGCPKATATDTLHQRLKARMLSRTMADMLLEHTRPASPGQRTLLERFYTDGKITPVNTPELADWDDRTDTWNQAPLDLDELDGFFSDLSRADAHRLIEHGKQFATQDDRILAFSLAEENDHLGSLDQWSDQRDFLPRWKAKDIIERAASGPTERDLDDEDLEKDRQQLREEFDERAYAMKRASTIAGSQTATAIRFGESRKRQETLEIAQIVEAAVRTQPHDV